jgi:hypothetical protein
VHFLFAVSQLDTPAFVGSAAVSPTGAYMAFGDSDGVIHILTAADEGMPFNGYEGQPVEWADSPEPLPDIDWTDNTYVSPEICASAISLTRS